MHSALSPFQEWLVSQPPGTIRAMVLGGVAASRTLSRLVKDPTARVSHLVAMRIHVWSEGAIRVEDLSEVHQ